MNKTKNPREVKKSDYAIGYQVWRSVDGKKGVCIKTIKGGDVTSFTDTNLKEGTTYIYWIKSYRMDYQNKKIYSRLNYRKECLRKKSDKIVHNCWRRG